MSKNVFSYSFIVQTLSLLRPIWGSSGRCNRGSNIAGSCGGSSFSCRSGGRGYYLSKTFLAGIYITETGLASHSYRTFPTKGVIPRRCIP